MFVCVALLTGVEEQRLIEDIHPSHPLVLHFEDIEYFVRIRGTRIKHVLRNVHGVAAPHHPMHPVRSPKAFSEQWICLSLNWAQ